MNYISGSWGVCDLDVKCCGLSLIKQLFEHIGFYLYSMTSKIHFTFLWSYLKTLQNNGKKILPRV